MLWHLTTEWLENPAYVIILWLDGEIPHFITELSGNPVYVAIMWSNGETFDTSFNHWNPFLFGLKGAPWARPLTLVSYEELRSNKEIRDTYQSGL